MTLKKMIKMILPYGAVRAYQRRFDFISTDTPVKTDTLASLPAGNEIQVQEESSEVVKPNCYVEVINFQVNNICNSHCSMCNVWKTSDNSYIPIAKFRSILSDPFFSQVRAVGITGGEPTLKNDLIEYFRLCIDTLSCLKSLSLISNCVNYKKTVQAARDLYEICSSNGIICDIMLSVDGIGRIHDLNRGVPGNFNSFERVASELKQSNIPFHVGTTITKNNVWDLENVLCYMQKNQICCNFRIAAYIGRLKNKDYMDSIGHFDEDEKYQLLLFFFKIASFYSEATDRYWVYKNIFEMLKGKQRQISCWYQTSGVNLSSTGEMSFCSVDTRPLSTLPFIAPSESKRDILKNDIVNTLCPYCIHDIGGGANEYMAANETIRNTWKNFFTVDFFFKHCNSVLNDFCSTSKQIAFVIGWYGTETVGDKAILGEIINELRSNEPNLKIVVSSLYPFITKRTIKELDCDADVVPVYSQSFFEFAASSCFVCVAGGPLMELEELSLILWAFYLAKNNGNRTKIWGCGVGPLYTEGKTFAVKRILEMADEILVRDIQSQQKVAALQSRNIATVIDDPSIPYIKNMIFPHKDIKPHAAFFLRELTFEYRARLECEDFLVFKQHFEESLAANIRNLCAVTGLKPCFYAMHNFVIGGDDRDFNYRFTKSYLSDLDCYVENKLSTVKNITEAMQSSSINICMRFHSVVFAHTLSTKFIAIDYTSGGKVAAFAKDHFLEQNIVTMSDLINSQEMLTVVANGLGSFQ